MRSDEEISHLANLMPASGRMYCKIIDRPSQRGVIAADLPKPWQQSRPVFINFDLWQELPRSQRDMLFLRTVCWATTTQLLKLNWRQGAIALGLLGTAVELAQRDVMGVMVGAGLTAWAGYQVWKGTRSSAREIEADEGAIAIAKLRGYDEQAAARALLAAIETVSSIENRVGLDFVELLRCQNLRTIAGLSSVEVPLDLRQP
ncbi:MAG: DUF3318 domain-containing protein [Kaiparowitsia implicata GSE-PSE-MK54-09C]|jgi:hypothetical protein|nr:DUF3318 domain-containing protein [Kaiparowitsia implicata GSE-PSE-MK54-09C]